MLYDLHVGIRTFMRFLINGTIDEYKQTDSNSCFCVPVKRESSVIQCRWRGLSIGKTLILRGLAHPASALIIIIMVSKRECLRNWKENVVKRYL